MPLFAIALLGLSPTDQVIVTDKAVGIEEVRVQLEKADDAFYSAYNALMKDRDYQVTCSSTPRTGTRLEKKVCRPGFVEHVAESHFNHWGTGGGSVSPEVLLQEKMPIFRQKMADLVRANPPLAALLEKRGKLQERYDALLREHPPR